MTAIQKAREALETALNSIGDLIVVNGQVSWAAVARIQDELIRDVAALAALDAETEVKVRALEWVEPSRQTNGCWTAPCIFGVYSVVNEGGWYAMLEGGPSGHCFEWYGHDMSKDTLATAKAAAQADYERRIRSALVPPESRS